ncbi:MAG: helix-hairpin-helix domain-containing protein [Candidatus Hermodarchaeota archaeon]
MSTGEKMKNVAGEASSQYVLETLGEEIGPTTRRLLKKAGFKDIRDLASAKTEELQAIQGINSFCNNFLI